ncbi:MAG: DUF86 domain-containing protein [Caldilineae bacterium]|nr:MAG: DUF86 domain-containing protein [Caldilineae bacterium]
MKNGIILQNLQTLEQILAELRSLGSVTAQQLNEDWRIRRAVERDLQILVEIVVDVCQRILSLTQQSPATTGAEAIARCVQLGVLPEQETYRKMVQFRNFIVHRYERVDTDILAGMVNRHLQDFERFQDEVLAYVRGDAG